MASSKPSRESGRAPRVVGWLLIVLAALIGLPLLVLWRFTTLHTQSHLLVAAATFIPFGWVPCIIGALGLLLVLRRYWKMLTIAPLVIAFIVWGWPNIPIPFNGTPAAVPLGIEMVSLNTQYGRADIDRIKELTSPDTDLLIFQEYTSAFDAKITQSGLAAGFPYRVGTIREDAGGTMILSRRPLTEVTRTSGTAFDNLLVSVNVRERDWLVAGIHTAPPQLGADVWANDAQQVLAMLTPHLDQRLIAAGDFNAIDQHHTMVQFRAAGLVNPMNRPTATRRANNWAPTWPIDGPVPPFARIDHVLGSPAAHIWRPGHVEVAGSDHLGLVIRGPLR